MPAGCDADDNGGRDLTVPPPDSGSTRRRRHQAAADAGQSAGVETKIEAARAGDAGKGSAVVVSELKGLALRTAMAIKEIGGPITQVHIATKEAATQGVVGTIEEVGTMPPPSPRPWRSRERRRARSPETSSRRRRRRTKRR